ncbi:MAG: hypothetical protein DRJ05_08000, partial [Bacteroidetes bacterium]
MIKKAITVFAILVVLAVVSGFTHNNPDQDKNANPGISNQSIGNTNNQSEAGKGIARFWEFTGFAN